MRLTSGDRTYYSYSDDLSEADLQRAADAVSAALRGDAGGAPVTDLGAVRRGAAARRASPCRPPRWPPTSRRRCCGPPTRRPAPPSPAVSQVSAGYLESRQRLLVANSLGAFVADDRTRVRFTVSAVARRDGVIQTGYESLGKSLGFEILDEGIAQAMARAAAGKAVTMLDARPAPTGPMTVVMGNGFGGTLFHEACGHGLEADGIAKGSSIYEGRMGDLVASTIVNAYDDGTIAGEWGSAAVDDEGAATQNTVVIEEGRLRGFLYDGLRAREQGVAQTGNGRRQSFRHVPIPRMTTTCIAPGEASADDIVAATERGFYAKTLAGGQVEPASGNFVFGVAEGYLIEHGRITAPLRGATLVGNGIDVLSEHRHDRLRFRGQVRHLRQGRPERAGGHRPGHAAHRRHDGGRYGLMIEAVDRLLELALAAGRQGRRGLRRAERDAARQGLSRGGRRAHLGASQGRRSARLPGRLGGLCLHLRSLRRVARRGRRHGRSPTPGWPTPTPTPCCRRHAPSRRRSTVFDPGLEQATDEQRIDLALAVERAALAADPRVKSVDESVYADGDAQVFLANSGGVRGRFREGHCYAYAYVLGEQDGQIETGLSFTVGRKPADLDPQRCGAEAATRAVELLGATKPKTTRTTVVLDPFVSASFFGVLSSALTAEAVQKGRSLFAGRVGEQIAGPGVTLTDDGIHPDGLASAPFDGEGVPCRRTPLIADGVLQGFLYNVTHRPSRRARLDRQRRARLVSGHARRGADQPRAVGPAGAPRRAHRRHRARRAGH